ncbi:hypothetical protein IGB42_03683 [Andreprevotia sp. IGB-42]|uniref:hypothetical protein n=1 Tax=Andreprevotia sp. IGB-42 TaxID=2497473 RepID=UPI001359DEAF|nr:hypothetical protein [Andreprevotia sp. IGB-42]KAF0811873.1 hypothetical protein IGB42_03683 [Andreprevotia sp. IGB-42]
MQKAIFVLLSLGISGVLYAGEAVSEQANGKTHEEYVQKQEQQKKDRAAKKSKKKASAAAASAMQ